MNTPALLLLGRGHSELYVLHWFLEFSHGISGLITHYCWLPALPHPAYSLPDILSKGLTPNSSARDLLLGEPHSSSVGSSLIVVNSLLVQPQSPCL